MGRGGTCTKRHFLLSLRSAAPQASHLPPQPPPHRVRSHPSPQRPAPLAARVNEGQGRSWWGQASHAPRPSPHCPGVARSPSRGSSPPPNRVPPPGSALSAAWPRFPKTGAGTEGPSARGALSGTEEGIREHQGRNRQVKHNRHFLRPSPRRPRGYRRLGGGGARILTLRFCSRQPSARWLATDREPEVTAD